MNSKNFTILTIVIAIILAGANFALFSNLEGNATAIGNLLASLGKGKAQQASAAILPDIPKGKSYASSPSRNNELKNIINNLPYTDPHGQYAVLYDTQTKDVTVSIPKAADLTDYRIIKNAAELKIQELGADNICLLLILWTPPSNLKTQLTKQDEITSSCSH